MAAQAAAGVETILKQPAQQGLVLGKRHHAIAQVAGRKDAVLAAQAAGTAAVIGNRHHRDEIGNRMMGVGPLPRSDVAFQAAQQHGKAGAAADGHNAHGTGAPKRWTMHVREPVRRQSRRDRGKEVP